MPLPEPKADETQQEFVSRCMENPTAKSDFPNANQRVAVCYAQYENVKKRNYYESKRILK